ncbi:hypothetical protein, partial [Cetobacterium sp.]|uniref:hypothetical protein n=1 Tax=Cetobacterium sp. TaxID=2071632 RepID=UPI003EE49AEE
VQTFIDTLHMEVKTQKVITKEAGCSQSSVSKKIVKRKPVKEFGVFMLYVASIFFHVHVACIKNRKY